MRKWMVCLLCKGVNALWDYMEWKLQVFLYNLKEGECWSWLIMKLNNRFKQMVISSIL